jgi:hypothetical protein
MKKFFYSTLNLECQIVQKITNCNFKHFFNRKTVNLQFRVKINVH